MILKFFILLLPTQLTFHFWPDFSLVNGIRVDYLAPAIYFTDFLVLLLIADWLLKRGGHKALSKNYIYVLIFLAFINIFFSQIPPLSLYRWLRIGEGLLLFLYVSQQKNFLSKIKSPLLLSLIFTLLLSLAQIMQRGSVNGLFYFLGERAFTINSPGIALATIFGNEYLRPYSTFPHPNVLGGYALVSFFLFRKLKWRFSLLGQAVSLLLVIISFSQNAWLTVLLAPLTAFVINFSRSRIQKFITASVVSSFLLTLISNFTNAPQEIAQRIELNAEAGRIISTAPILGVGAGAFISQLAIRHLQPVHNMFLLVASEIGIAGLLVFVYFIFKNTNKFNLVPVVAMVMLSMWDHYFVTIAQTSLLFFMVLGYNGKSKHENLL